MPGEDIGQLLRWGNADGILRALAPLTPDERAARVAPLSAAAAAISQAAPGDTGTHWDGPRSSGHLRAAALVQFPRPADLFTQVPQDRTFIAEDIPVLFPHQAARILHAWGELHLRHPTDRDRADRMLAARHWFSRIDVPVPATRGVALLLLTGGPTAAELYAWPPMHGGFGHRLLRTAFAALGVPGAGLEDNDSRRARQDSLGGFLVPALIGAGVLRQDEVLAWCEDALHVPGRTQYEASWFHRLRRHLRTHPIPVIAEDTERFWLAPSAQLITADDVRRAGFDGAAELSLPEVQELLPVARLLEALVFSTLTRHTGHLAATGGEQLDDVVDVLKASAVPEAADLIRQAEAHARQTHPDAPLPHDTRAAAWERAERLDDRWLEVEPAVQSWLEARLAPVFPDGRRRAVPLRTATNPPRTPELP